MLKPTKKWTPEVEALIERFKALGPAGEPFQLTPWAYVLDPVKFHQQLAADIAFGPDSTRARTGALASELEIYVRARGNQ